MEEATVQLVQARLERVTVNAVRAELIFTAELSDDVFALAQAVGRECALAVQLVPEPVA